MRQSSSVPEFGSSLPSIKLMTMISVCQFVVICMWWIAVMLAEMLGLRTMIMLPEQGWNINCLDIGNKL